MPAAPLHPLPENTGLAFIGEAPWPPASLTPQQAKAFLGARNPAGRPNGDVLRALVGHIGGRRHAHWQIDFPAHYPEQEAALHERPFAELQKKFRGGSGSWWVNPHSQPPLRHALARLDRFLATALDSPEPAWFWVDSDRLPDASLLAVARDDDFTHAVLQSHAFTLWWRAHHRSRTPVPLVESFPFPWPPATPLGSLSRAQQDFRSRAVRAVTAGDAEAVNSAVAAAYGWSGNYDAGEILTALHEVCRNRITG